MSPVLPEIQANEIEMRVCYWPEPIISAGRKDQFVIRIIMK